MSNAALSNRERKRVRKAVLKPSRYAAAGAAASRPVVARESKEAGPLKREGIEWLVKRNRLNPRRLAAARFYRDRFMNADGVSLKSCIDPTSTGGAAGPGIHADAGTVSLTQAKRDLFTIRYTLLAGQHDMLTVMDGVCGVGHTLRELAGGSQIQAATLEAVLMVALDLVARWLDTRDAVRPLQINSNTATNNPPQEIRVASTARQRGG